MINCFYRHYNADYIKHVLMIKTIDCNVKQRHKLTKPINIDKFPITLPLCLCDTRGYTDGIK